MTIAFACDLKALTRNERTRHQALRRALRPRILSVEELGDGYAVRFEAEPSMLMRLARFIALESRCCPFLHLGVELEAERGPLWLSIRGTRGVKKFIRDEFGFSEVKGKRGA
jgi:hypothetical protein